MIPNSEAELAQIVSEACKEKTALRILGGGTKQAMGNPVSANASLSTRGLSGITFYEPAALTLVAKSGTPLAEIEQTIAKNNQRLAFEPRDYRGLLKSVGTPTIGGTVACNNSGPRRIQSGACRDFLIGVRFVTGLGQIVKNGGRVMKNVTGYDLVKLLAGSYGSLAVLTEVAFKLLPLPETSATILIENLDDGQAIAALSRALASPYEVSGAAHLSSGLHGAPLTMIRVEGFVASVVNRTEKLKRLLHGFGEISVQTDPVEDSILWDNLRDITPFHSLAGDIWRVNVKPSDGSAVTTALLSQAVDYKAIFDWGGGLVWLLLAEGTDLRKVLSGIEGHASLIRGSAENRALLGAFAYQPKTVSNIARGLRGKFDPGSILNPGIMA